MVRPLRPELEPLLEEARTALEAEDPALALERAERGERASHQGDLAELAADFALVAAAALNQLGRSSEALVAAERVLKDWPDDPDAMLERGVALWELNRLDEAAQQLRALLRQEPEDAWAHHTLGLVAERRGESAEAERRFARARKLAPEDFPVPPHLGPDEFDAVVEAALAELPAPVRSYLSNVAIAVEELPSDDDLRGDPPLSPGILGVFRGAPLGEKASMNPWSHFPSSIVLYQRNLERTARDQEELVDEIGATLVHEVGHFLGLDEEQLWERGLG